jgi:DNA-binding response OmpR family regulator
LSGYQVSGARDEQECIAALAGETFDLILLDLNLPDCDGLDLLSGLREHLDTLLFVVSGRSDERSRLSSLELGADDYITKPFSARELELRMRNMLRRQESRGRSLEFSPSFLPTFSGWKIDESARRVERDDGTVLNLTLAEYELLLILVNARGAVVRRDQMLDTLAQVAHVGNPETLNALVYRLRRKLARGTIEPDPIMTLSGVGYQLKLDDARATSEGELG